MIVNMDLLRKNLPRTYRTVCRDLDLFLPSDELDIDLNDARLGSYTRGELTGWSLAQKKAQQPEIVEPPKAMEPPKPAEPLPPQIDFKELLKEEAADLQRAADTAGAKNRLQQLADEEGLEESDANVAAIKQFLQQHARGYLSEEGVNAAYANLGPRGQNILTFRVQAAALSPAPEPVEVLGTLKDGSKQLPLDTVPNKHHTTAQLKDYLARVNAGKLIRPRGSWGSSL
jgi:hypothetical protein